MLSTVQVNPMNLKRLSGYGLASMIASPKYHQFFRLFSR
ncbi:hypothetical protein KKH3_44120 [Pectobacterium actinidiae]|nr:hypothetical protein KKH3_44120 [Pectobacterium actinidiae]